MPVAANMASAPTSPPTGNMSTPTSPQLTPRSKLKAMLAAVDDSSDDGGKGPIDTKALFAAIDKNKQKPNSAGASSVESADESDNEDTEIIRPRGRIAARMHANFAVAEKAQTPPSKTPRRDQQVRTSPSTSEHSSTAEGPSHGGDDEDEGEDDVVAPSRRKLARPDRGLTPETAIQEDQHVSPRSLESSSPSKRVILNRNPIHSDSDDEEDMPTDLSKSARFKALVEKKRKERLDKEADEERKQMERAQRMREQIQAGSDADEDDVSDISDDEGGHRLTQDTSRPARKASKKALEEMNRETQRLSRSLQLSHEIKTKKKISKASLFQRFNFQVEGSPAEGNTAEREIRQPGSSRPTTPGSTPQTDAELENNGTPPSSLPTSPKRVISQPITTMSPLKNNLPAPENENGDSELKAMLAPSNNTDKAAPQADKTAPPFPQKQQPTTKTLPRRFRVKLPPTHTAIAMVDFDEELDISSPVKKDKLDAVFARIPESKAQESSEMKVLRNLAHLSSPPREQGRGRNAKPSMTMGELHVSLQQRAKAQAKLERERHVESLRSKGIVVQSAEERQRAQNEIEDIVTRARREVEEIMQRERAEAKESRKKGQSHEADPLAWDDSDDDSYDGNKDELQDLELSGSEEDEQEDDEDSISGDEKAEDQAENNPMFMDEAEEAQSGDEGAPGSSDFSDNDIEEMKGSMARQSRLSKRLVQIISDDEDDEDNEDGVKATPRPKQFVTKSPPAPGSGSPKLPTSVLRSATKTFIPGLPIALAAPAGLGLTQIFAGTMDDSQAGSFNSSPKEFMPSIGQFPDSQFSATVGQSQQNDMVSDSQPVYPTDSQTHESQEKGLQLHYSQSQAHGFDSLIPEHATQMSYFVEPTQDSGFQDYTPLKQRFIDPPQSTTSTVLLTGAEDEAIIQESPLVRKRGRLLRRNEFADASSPLSLLPEKGPQGLNRSVVETDRQSGPEAASSSAFRLMAKAARREKRLKKFDKKKSKATEMVEDQAEESEDEYAGLGGADGEDSSEEDEEFVKEMIDDSRENEWDAAQLAGMHADHDRAKDAAQVDKLFRDLTTGGLRKRRRGGDGHDFDLSDSDDGGEARRRMKRRQFTKMQKALFADERIGKIAENPRTAAFLKSIEDMKDDEELDFGNNFADTTSTSGDDSQSQNVSEADQAIPDSQPRPNHRKRSHMDDHDPRPRPDERRTKNSARPSPTVEVRRSLSTLLDDPNASAESIVLATDFSSDSDGEEGHQSTSPPNKENRRSRRHVSGTVIDRIMLKRNSSSSLSADNTSVSARLAFTASSTAGSGFKVPNLLRRATTNSTKLSASSNTNASTTTSNTSQASTGGKSGFLNKAADFSDDGKLKKTAGKRSGINYFAHENERRAKVAEAEKRREARKWKGAEGRSKVVGSLFGSGSFE